jgi:hypothetical protein
MGLKWLFSAIFSVLFHPETFWNDARERFREVNAMKDYAAPVIAIVQFAKLPFIHVPRMAMLLAIISFTIDVAVLYVLTGVMVSAAEAERSAPAQHEIMTALSFSLTPIWLAEPFGFAGTWRWLFMAAALAYTVFISRTGLQAMLGSGEPGVEAFSGKAAFLVGAIAMISFLLQNGLIRFFTSI